MDIAAATVPAQSAQEWTRQTTISLTITCTGSLVVAAQALGLDVTDVEALCTDLVNAGMIERSHVQ